MVVSGGARHLVQSCDVHDVDGGGIYIRGGDPNTLTPAEHAVVNSDICRVGLRQRVDAPGVDIGGVGNRIANCRIRDLPHSAIIFAGNDHRIERNEISHACMEINECGVIYGTLNILHRGTVIRENFVHHIGNRWGPRQGAVYTDEGHGGVRVVSNIFYRVGYEHPHTGVLLGNGHNSSLYSNNIFIDCKAPVGGHCWPPKQWRTRLRPGGGGLSEFRKLPAQARSLYISRYPELAGAWENDEWLPPASEVTGNLGILSGRFELRGVTFNDNLGTSEDPGFADMEAMDFTLNDLSWIRARLKNFEPIPFAEIGLQRDR